jgi:hypothetical protein
MEHTIDSKLKSLIVNWSGGVTKEEKITHDATLRELGIKTYGDFLNIIKKKLS